MAITSPFSVLLFTNRQESVRRVRQAVSENPASPVWWTWIFMVILSISAVPLQHMIHPTAHPLSWHQDAVVCILTLVIGVIGVFSMNYLATWGMHHQQRKSWGSPLPESEPRVLGFRTGIWVGAATSYAMCILLKILYICFSLLMIIMSQPQQAASMSKTMNTVVVVLSLLYFSHAIADFYGIQRRLFVLRYLVIPVVIVSVFGIVLAIVLGQYAQYKNTGIVQQKHHSQYVAPVGHATGAVATSAHSEGIPRTAKNRVQPLNAVRIAHGPIAVSDVVQRDDAHCLGGLPLSAPWVSSGQTPVTVVHLVSRMSVMRDIAWNNRALHGMLAPVYLRDRRVLVHPDSSSSGVTMLAVVPSGMHVFLGEHVQMSRFHAFHRMPCTYVPNLIVFK